MERGHIPHTQLSPDPDIDFMDIDEDLVVPDTPDRVSTQHKNVCNRTPLSASFNPKSYGLADRGVFGRKANAFADRGQHSGVCAPFGSSGDVGTMQDGHNHIIPSSLFGNVAVPNVVASRTLKQQGSHLINSWHNEVEKFPYSEFFGQSDQHGSNNGPVLVKHGEFGSSSSRTFGDPSKSTKNENKDKMRIDNDSPTHHVTHHKKRNDSICNVASERATGKGVSMPSQSARLPCMDSPKRLVQNRRISPHNIAKGKQLAGSSVSVSTDACGNEFSGISNRLVDVNEVIAKNYGATRAKGKGIVIPTSSSNGHEGRRSANGRFSGLWRKENNQEIDSIFGKDNFSSAPIMGTCSSSFSPAVLEPMSLLSEDQVRTPSTTIKKQKKHDCSVSSPEESTEVIQLSSCGESSAEKSPMDHGGHSQRVMSSLSPIDVGELSSEVRESDTQAEARAMQLQLDEMLARELQEQLYNEIPEAATGELPRGDASARPRGNRHEFGARAVTAPSTQMQSQSGSSRGRLNRRGPQAWFNTSSVARLRNRANRGSSLVSSVEREMLSPAEMDFDMRIELLERLQAFFNEDVGMVNQLLESDREFDENDYELLLALDENNHVHLGASTAQIANLPESTVHNDSFEACSICLETPVIGDTIRHLPCLHKFHKGCIDPWLRRKRSCPVCKSDI